ncbi:hypothetical protein N7510_007313 [Penicillium lagena]|uniref:uncharacterized protein n=1 Tax=Penicillium lagena TaxID=94218 RepID=UPI0025411239|nr:uncharacterized protein N7510_007313 [Penicillium lagena]KAJ5610594.1 hypothetical protein N7510_007313 [Penicillium lagena]
MPAPSTGPSKGNSNNNAPTRRVVDPNSLPARRGPRPTPIPRLPTGAQDIRQTKEYKVAARRYVLCFVFHNMLPRSFYYLLKWPMTDNLMFLYLADGSQRLWHYLFSWSLLMCCMSDVSLLLSFPFLQLNGPALSVIICQLLTAGCSVWESESEAVASDGGRGEEAAARNLFSLSFFLGLKMQVIVCVNMEEYSTPCIQYVNNV